MARARVFDIDKAVDTATDLFWRKGYERTSLSDLTEAMGITPPSFYYAFGSKDGLFKIVVENYIATRVGYAEAALNEPTAREVVGLMLLRFADLYTDPSRPRGCLLVNNGLTLTCAADAAPAAKDLVSGRDLRRERLYERLLRAKSEGDLLADSDPSDLARFVMVIGWGLATAALAGATREELHRTVATALQAWPTRLASA